MGCGGYGLYCLCEPRTEWKGQMELEQCFEKCKDYKWFIHATYRWDHTKDCMCVLENATCGMNQDSAKEYGAILYKNLRKSNSFSLCNKNLYIKIFRRLFH